MSQPVSHQFEPLILDTVYPGAALFLVSNQAGRFEDPEMPGCGLPGVLENRRDFARCHGAAVEINRQQHTTPGGMSQRAKNQFISVNARFRLTLCQ